MNLQTQIEAIVFFFFFFFFLCVVCRSDWIAFGFLCRIKVHCDSHFRHLTRRGGTGPIFIAYLGMNALRVDNPKGTRILDLILGSNKVDLKFG